MTTHKFYINVPMLILILRLHIRRSIIMIPPSRRHRYYYYYYYYYSIGQTHWRLSTGFEMKGIEKEREREWERKENWIRQPQRSRIIHHTQARSTPKPAYRIQWRWTPIYNIYRMCIFLEMTFWNTTLNTALPYSRI